MNTDESKRRRRGPAPLDATDKRGHTVSVRLNDAELARLDSQRDAVQMQRGEYLRAAALHRLPPTIPEVNREAWAALARTAANLNQIAHRLNAGDALPLAEVRATLDAFRRDLIGVKHDAEDAEDESQG
ncbi:MULTISPECIES: plasmid mobilization protein [Enterobacteriaceae]|uniref:plasmid mobilization protein n=1 Tax=Enterobacteriaceae TaxID=543 RepID=UPI000E6A0456|nr:MULTISPECIES: plasmid mobilization relaxosome protein MobC [Enterobacteriaceae]EBY5440606.1 plasmid mobilization relaxosome protein MobC [Salmonella enterica subsp. enterica serovar Virchow]MCR2799260.1 plasmid mobilization relaxosome protein MobC [Enterobacter kobei]MDR5971493.1 plasmid mobilization relaxosome protein MobC [Escherichia coli]RIU55862.1 plasmid mobilization relaxosome protein MobC [Klebsiella pneumoniae]RIV20158.1 plasmid mobilization relaxosome protein MobC [Klebsiella pneu